MGILFLLKPLGFSRSEAKVYAALLDVGANTAGEVIKKSGLHRNIVYECLDKLKDRKLRTGELLPSILSNNPGQTLLIYTI